MAPASLLLLALTIPVAQTITLATLQPTLTCGTAILTVTFNTKDIKSLGISTTSIRLINQTCIFYLLSSTQLGYQWLTGLSQCGSTVSVNSTYVTVSNSIYLPLTGGKNYLLNISCTYPLSMKSSLMTLAQPAESLMSASSSTYGQYIFGMALYKDAGFLNPYMQGEPALFAQDYLYAGLFITDGDPTAFSMVAINCFTTPTNNVSDAVKYYLIQNGCSLYQNGTVQLMTNGGSTGAQLGVQLFNIIGNYKSVYLHCEFNLCFLLSGTSCVPTCPSTSTLTTLSVFSLGPITQKDPTTTITPATTTTTKKPATTTPTVPSTTTTTTPTTTTTKKPDTTTATTTTTTTITTTTTATTTKSTIPNTTTLTVPTTTTTKKPDTTTPTIPATTTTQLPDTTTPTIPDTTTPTIPDTTTSTIPATTTPTIPDTTTPTIPDTTTPTIPDTTTSTSLDTTTPTIPDTTTSTILDTTTPTIPALTTTEMPATTTSKVPDTTTLTVPATTTATSKAPASTTTQMPATTTATSKAPAPTTTQRPATTTSAARTASTSKAPAPTTTQMPATTTSSARTTSTSKAPGTTTLKTPNKTTSKTSVTTTKNPGTPKPKMPDTGGNAAASKARSNTGKDIFFVLVTTVGVFVLKMLMP